MRSLTIALAIAIAVLAIALAMEPTMVPPKTVTVTRTMERTLAITKLLTITEPTTIVVTKSLEVTKLVPTTIEKLVTITAAIPTTITKTIVTTETLENEKTVTTTVAKTITETKTITTTAIERILETITKTVTNTITTTKTIEKNAVLGVATCTNDTGLCPEIYEFIDKWVSRANNSVYGMMNYFVAVMNMSMYEVFDNLSKKGIKIALIDFVPTHTVGFPPRAKWRLMCKYLVGETIIDALLTSAIAIDGKIVLIITWSHVAAIYSPELAKIIENNVKSSIGKLPPPLFCQLLQHEKNE